MTVSFAPAEKILVDDTTSETYRWIGVAPCGTNTGVAKWQITG